MKRFSIFQLAVCLLCMLLAGCGAGTPQQSAEVPGAVEEATSDDPSPVPEGETEEQEPSATPLPEPSPRDTAGNDSSLLEGVFYADIDTARFDPSRYDGSLYIGGQRFAAPVRMSALVEAGYQSDFDIETGPSERRPSSLIATVDGERTIIFETDLMQVYNPGDTPAAWGDCVLGQLLIRQFGEDVARANIPVGIADWTLEELPEITVEYMVDLLGAPAQVGYDGGELLYYYYFYDHSAVWLELEDGENGWGLRYLIYLDRQYCDDAFGDRLPL